MATGGQSGDERRFAAGTQLSQLRLTVPGLESEPFFVIDMDEDSRPQQVFGAYDERFATPVEPNADSFFARRRRLDVFRVDGCDGQPVAFAPTLYPTAPFVSLWRSRLAGGHYRTMALAPRSSSFHPDTGDLFNSMCATENLPSDEKAVTLVGDPIDDELVKETGSVLVPLTDRVSVEAVTGSDGFVGLGRDDLDFWDRHRGNRCRWWRPNQNTQAVYCVPNQLYGDVYLDSGCTQVDPTYGDAPTSSDGIVRRQYASIVRPVVASAPPSIGTRYELWGSSCREYGRKKLVELGEVIPLMELPHEELTTVTAGSMRLHRFRLAGIDFAALVEHKPARSNFFFDCEIRPYGVGVDDFYFACDPAVIPDVPHTAWPKFGLHRGALAGN